jgi:hypothetical protein
LQQANSFAGKSGQVFPIGSIGAEAVPVGDEPIPADVAFMVIADQHVRPAVALGATGSRSRPACPPILRNGQSHLILRREVTGEGSMRNLTVRGLTSADDGRA